MPFTLIKGRFVPEAGIPDGDSVRFRADDMKLWKKLEGKPPKIGTGTKTKGTVQLRFEGIDAIEKGATKPLSSDATKNMKALLGYSPDDDPEPKGYILTRMTDDLSGRPIAFAFPGTTQKKDGSEAFLDAAMLRDSVNHIQMKQGFAYALYYNTLFEALRNEFDAALEVAKVKKRGYWPSDATKGGVTVKTMADLETIPPIWPKLWRRLEEYLRNNTSLAGFVDWLEVKNERIDVLSRMEERGLQDLVAVSGNRVNLLEPPENLRVVGKAGKRRR